MGKASKELIAFINAIPDSKLEALPAIPRTIHRDGNFRLDMQGMTSGNRQAHNLQVQSNEGTAIIALKRASPTTAAGPVLVPLNGTMAPAEIKNMLLRKTKL